jgi:hypothetical protein
MSYAAFSAAEASCASASFFHADAAFTQYGGSIMDATELRAQIEELKRRRDDPETSADDREDIQDAVLSLGLDYQFCKAFADDLLPNTQPVGEDLTKTG